MFLSSYQACFICYVFRDCIYIGQIGKGETLLACSRGKLVSRSVEINFISFFTIVNVKFFYLSIMEVLEIQLFNDWCTS